MNKKNNQKISLESKLNQKQKLILKKATDLISKHGRPGDIEHIYELLTYIFDDNIASLNIDYDIIIPTAILHDIGHISILPEHFKYITGSNKLKNSKLVHMLVGAKIAKDILESVNYNKKHTSEIIDIISIHDADKIEEWGLNKFDTRNKKIFHDLDKLDTFNKKRLEKFMTLDNNPNYLKKYIKEVLNSFFYEEIKNIALNKIKDIKIFLS